MTIAKRIPDEPYKQSVDGAFDVLCGLWSVEHFADKLPPDLRANYTQVDTSRWTETETWVDWWKQPHILKKLSKTYSLLSVEDCMGRSTSPGSTNPVEPRQRTQRPLKPPERRSALSSKSKHRKDIPIGKGAIGTCISVEFYIDSALCFHYMLQSNHYIIRYNKQGYLITFDDCGPEDNEIIKLLKKSVEKREIKIL